MNDNTNRVINGGDGSNSLPSSSDEKSQEFKESGFRIAQWIYVHELLEMLEQFKLDDWIELNQVRNINVHREGMENHYATIDLHKGEVEFWDREDEWKK